MLKGISVNEVGGMVTRVSQTALNPGYTNWLEDPWRPGHSGLSEVTARVSLSGASRFGVSTGYIGAMRPSGARVRASFCCHWARSVRGSLGSGGASGWSRSSVSIRTALAAAPCSATCSPPPSGRRKCNPPVQVPDSKRLERGMSAGGSRLRSNRRSHRSVAV